MAGPALAKHLRFDIIGNDLSRVAFENVKRNALLTGTTLRSALSTVGVPLSIGALALSFAKLTDDAMNFADTLKAQADKLQLSTDRLQEYRYAAKATGAAYEDADAALASWTRRLGEAQQGTGKSVDVLKQYNVSLFDNAGRARDAETVLRDLFDVVSRLRDPQERLRVLSRAGGDELARLSNLAREGSDGLDRLSTKAREVGQVLGRDAVDSLAATRAKVDELNKQLEINGYKTAANLSQWRIWASELQVTISGALEKVAEQYSAWTTNIAEMTPDKAKTREAWLDWVEGIVDYIEDNFPSLKIDPIAQPDVYAGSPRVSIEREREKLVGFSDPADPKSWKTTVDEATASTEGYGDAAAAASVKTQDLIEKIRFEREQLARTNLEQEIYANLKTANVSLTSSMGAAIATETAALYEAQQAQKNFNDLLEYGGDTAIDFIDRLALRGDNLADVLGDIGQAMAKLVLQAAIMGGGPFADFLGTASTGSGPGGIAGALGSLFGGSRAGGGDLAPGRVYRVHKDEWIVPSQAGSVVPMRGGGEGGVVNNVSVHNYSGEESSKRERENGSGGLDIDVIIGNSAAKQMTQPGSAPNRALGQMGVRTPPTRR